jgi:AcrR family transcriptional regulator
MKSGAKTQIRTYTQTTRAESSEDTRRRIVHAFGDLVRKRWIDEIRLIDVAKAAKVTVQTVIRRFGGKNGLINAIPDVFGMETEFRRRAASGSVSEAIKAMVADYEISGDFYIRLLAQEHRHPALKQALDIGRAKHRAWNEALFKSSLEALPAAARERHLKSLIAMTDVYVWRLYRRDMNLSTGAVATQILETISKLNVAVSQVPLKSRKTS